MRLLLTSGGVTNTSIHDVLVELLGKPIAESSAVCIPTAMYGHPMAGPGVKAWQFISGTSENPMVELGWKSVGVLELTALPSIDEEHWVPLVRENAAVRADGPACIAERDGLGGSECREHGDDPQDRRGLRPVETAHR